MQLLLGLLYPLRRIIDLQQNLIAYPNPAPNSLPFIYQDLRLTKVERDRVLPSEVRAKLFDKIMKGLDAACMFTLPPTHPATLIPSLRAQVWKKFDEVNAVVIERLMHHKEQLRNVLDEF